MIMYYDFQIFDCDSPQTLNRNTGKILIYHPQFSGARASLHIYSEEQEVQAYYY